MPTDKKLVAAAAHTRAQAEIFTAAVEAAQLKVVRAEEALDAAQDAYARAVEKADEKQNEADEAAAAASGIPTFANAQTAEMGLKV
jgi:hypothetical protein